MADGRASMTVGPPVTQEVTMPIYFLIGLTILILVIAVYATVAEEEDESTTVDSIPPSDGDAQTHEQQHEYRKAS
jgi:hypothetical protein